MGGSPWARSHGNLNGMSADAPLSLDLSDFDAVGVASSAVAQVRAHAIENECSTAATVSAPQGWHRVVLNCSATGHLNLRVRFVDLTTARSNNVSKALVERGWQLDEDRDGASVRYLPGTEAITVAFDMLGVLALAGAPNDVRSVTAVDSEGRAVDLHT